MHLVVARQSRGGGLELVTTEKELVRLGSGSGDMKQLAPDAMDRGIAALGRMVATANSLGADVIAVATSAVREAENQHQFLDRARREAGVEVEVISGFEEARLIHLGVLQALPVFDQRMMLFDIGGGSTEIVVGKGFEIFEARSMRLGAIRLTQRFFAQDKGEVTKKSVKRCREYVQQALAGISREFVGHQPEILVGSSGTAATLTAMAQARRSSDRPALNGLKVSTEELDELVELILETPSDRRRRIPGVDEKRADIIAGGALLAQQVVHMSGLDGFTFSEFALREGVLLDRFGALPDQHKLEDLRRGNALKLSRQLDPDSAHAEHAAKLSLQLFDRTQQIHGLSSEDRELLEMAALLHNVGLFISHSGHHKHSYYVIRNSEQLTGFSDHEVELIALIARYHRKALPHPKHAEFVQLNAQDQRRVSILAGLLRIGIGLDRRHSGQVSSLRVVIDSGVVIEPKADGDVSIEIHAARERSELLAVALEMPVLLGS